MRKKHLKFFVILTLLLATILPATSFAALPNPYYLAVDIFPNEENGICWACCGASCINYVAGRDTIPYSLCAYKGIYGPAPFSAVGDCLTHWGCVYNYTSSKPSFSTVKTSIAYGEPVIVACTSGSQGHAVELRGYYDGTNPSVSYMDPNFASYQAQYYSTFAVIDGWPITAAYYNPHPV